VTQQPYLSAMDYAPPATCLLLFLVRSVEMAKRRSEVKGTITAPYTLAGLIAGGSLVVACAIAEYFLRHRTFNAGFYVTGLVVGISSFMIRASAARSLGRFWSMQIELRKEQPLVTDGPYGWVRHPIYAAAVLEMVATLLICQAVWSIIPALLVFAPLLLLRIRREEEAMKNHFGDRYVAYMREVPAILAIRRARALKVRP
jgi:protein-S-isoprenylcysteine O-methyltransferase Ste14